MEKQFRDAVEPRRRQEKRDGRRVETDYTAIANLSKDVMYKEFPTGFQVERFKNEGNEE